MNKSKVVVGILSFICIFIIAIGWILSNKIDTSYSLDTSKSVVTVNSPDKTEQILKVFVIEINPLLNTIQDYLLYKNNDGHPKIDVKNVYTVIGWAKDKNGSIIV